MICDSRIVRTIAVIAAIIGESSLRARSSELIRPDIIYSEKASLNENLMRRISQLPDSDQPMETIAHSGRADGGILLGGKAQRIVLSPASERLDVPRVALASRLRALASNHALYVIIDGLTARGTPENVYNVYFDLEDGPAAKGTSDPRYIGTLQFYGAVGASVESAKGSAFNVTDLIRNLQLRNPESTVISVTLVPIGTPAKGAHPAVAGIRLVMK